MLQAAQAQDGAEAEARTGKLDTGAGREWQGDAATSS